MDRPGSPGRPRGIRRVVTRTRLEQLRALGKRTAEPLWSPTRFPEDVSSRQRVPSSPSPPTPTSHSRSLLDVYETCPPPFS